MPYVRRNIYSLGSEWNETVLWYARAVGEMKSRSIADPTSWRFFGAIHGIDQGLWQQLGWLSGSDTLPAPQVQAIFWNQCQHGTWYFLPWHRGYLLSIEAIMRSWIVAQGGPADWALPYWNYMNAGQNQLPAAFASPDWPDGTGDNPLYTAERYGPNNDGNVYVPQNMVNVNALGEADFSGPGGGGSAGFGGVVTAFSHSGRRHGDFEAQPHDYVHGLVGGEDPHSDPNNPLPGLMSDPDTAALDPIFYLHHANIDRYWGVWRTMGQTSGIARSHMNPSQPDWLDGPALVPPVTGQATGFAVPAVDGSEMVFMPAQVADLSDVDYEYDDLSNPFATPQQNRKVRLLGAAPGAAPALRTEAPVAAQNTELMGANDSPLKLTQGPVETRVRLAGNVAKRVRGSLLAARAEAAPAEPDRVFLNLENVRGLNDAKRFQVYVNGPQAPGTAAQVGQLAGALALFGVRKATQRDGEHAGNGLDFALEITDIVDALHLSGDADLAELQVRIVPETPVREADNVTIGRVSVYRQGR